MSRLTRDGTAEPVSRDQILRHARGQGNIHFPCSADHEQDWQPCPVDPYSAICDDHTYIHTCTVQKVIEGDDMARNKQFAFSADLSQVHSSSTSSLQTRLQYEIGRRPVNKHH